MKKVIITLIIIPILVLLLIIGNFIYTIEFKQTKIETIINDKNHYAVEFKSIGEPAWPFGPQKVKVTRNQVSYFLFLLTLESFPVKLITIGI